MRLSSGLLMIVLVLVAALGSPGCSLVEPTAAEIETMTAALTSAALVESFKFESVKAKFKPADLALVKQAVDSEVLPALSGQKPVSGAVARACILAVDRVLESRGSPPLTALTAAAVEQVASLIQTTPLSQALSDTQLAALRGFFNGLSIGLGEVIASYATPTPSPPPSASAIQNPKSKIANRNLPSLRPSVPVARSGTQSHLPEMCGAEPRARPRRLDL